MTPEILAARQAADRIIQDVAELPDRTSPEDQPDMMLVTADELRVIVETALAAVLPMVVRAHSDAAERFKCRLDDVRDERHFPAHLLSIIDDINEWLDGFVAAEDLALIPVQPAQEDTPR